MAALPPHLTHLAVRWFHVLGMAAVLGGAVLVWGTLRGYRVADDPDGALQIAATYEWIFWAGAGLLVLTGVGNLGAIAPAIPGPATSWGWSFSAKLAGVLGLLVGSMVRTLGVVGLLAGASGRPVPSSVDHLRFGYAATAVYLLLVVLLAEVLAHG